ncbi:MAG TPA: hypothetical protein VEL07_19395 [Planctomycetota bacterium]|nr:hypothetical protein [Planctomycetota bacterium]
MPKPSTSVIAEARGGLLNEELTEAIQKATTAVRATGRKAKVTLELTINAFGGEAGEVERVAIQDKITVKVPEPKKFDSVFFIDSNNNLQRQQTIVGVEPSASRDDAKKVG